MKRVLAISFLGLCSACAAETASMGTGESTVLQQRVLGIERKSADKPGGPSNETGVSAKPSRATQADVLKRIGSSELQIAATCRLTAGRVASCEYLRTLPDTPEVRRQSLRLLKEFVVMPAWPPGVGETNFALFDIRLAYEGTDLGAAGGCIVPLICGIGIPPPPPPRPDQ